jgi:hypothetical protein
MKPSKATVKKLRKLQEFIRKEPRRFDMSWWGTAVKEPLKLAANPLAVLIDQHQDVNFDLSVRTFLAQKPPCGTVACLAGSALMMAGKIKPRFVKTLGEEQVAVYDFGDETEDNATKYLGLPEGDNNLLFFVDQWPDRFSDGFEELTPKRQVERACKRIDYYIETGL